MQSLKIAHIYPEVLNLYGDRGNILCMERRLTWRGIGCDVEKVMLGDRPKLGRYDILFIGGGQDFDEGVILDDLKSGLGSEIRAAIEDGKTFLCICGGFQLLGRYYRAADGSEYEFLGAVDLYTEAGDKRMIGNYIFRLEDASGGGEVVGFENHSGRTFLGSGVSPLGRIVKGFGNNGEDGTEGVRYKNVFGTYCHGPALPKNAFFCDEILKTALERKYGSFTLDPLDDSFEESAREIMHGRIMAGTAEKDE